MLNPKFEEYVKGFKEVYKKRFNKEPVMRDYISNGWMNVKDKKFVNFYKLGKKHAEKIKDNR